MATIFIYFFISVLCFQLDELIAPDFDKNGNILVHGLFKKIISKLLLSLGFIYLYIFIVECLSIVVYVTKN